MSAVAGQRAPARHCDCAQLATQANACNNDCEAAPGRLASRFDPAEQMERALRQQLSTTQAGMENGLTLLATTGATAPKLLFLVGPWFGWWIVKGNLSYSYTLGLLPLTDPYVLLQSLVSGQMPQRLAIIGMVIVVAFYLVVGGRSFCSWVCPVNLVTDLAAWLRARLGIKGGPHVSRSVRYWILGATFVVGALTGTIAWEMLNPVSMLHRGLIFGIGLAWIVVLTIFLFDVFVMRNGWCGHFCPVGAFYSLIGRFSDESSGTSRPCSI